MMKFSDEEKIEKEILKKIEKKNNKQDEEMKEEEIETESEYLIRPSHQTTEEDNIKAHFDKINSTQLKKLAENKKLSRFDLLNEKFGNYKFQIANSYIGLKIYILIYSIIFTLILYKNFKIKH